MGKNDDSDYIPEESEASNRRSKRRRNFKLRVKNEDSLDSTNDTSFTPNGAGRNKKKKSDSQSESTVESVVYQCSLCPFQTYMKHKLKRHFTICLKGDRRSSRQKRRHKVTKGAKFLCEYCPFETTTLQNLLSHKESHAKLVASGLIECTHCNLTFFTVEDCTKHLNKSVDVRKDKSEPLVCLQCQRQADNQLQLVVHMAFHHVKPGSPLTCLNPSCDFETDHRDELKGHLMDTHKLKESNFQPLTDAYFKCPKCIYETKIEVHLNAHYLTNHSKDSEAPFRCPWSDCYTYLAHKRSLKRHLHVIHGMDPKDDTAVPPDDDKETDGSSLSCRDCGHKSLTDFQMILHRSLYHHPNSQKEFGCPVPECDFVTIHKQHVRRHLRGVHKLGDEHFRDYGVVRPEEQYESDVAEDVEERVDEDVDEVSVVEYDCDVNSLSKGTNRRRYNCGLCMFTSNYKLPFSRHQIRVHHKKKCDVCKKTVWGKYQWFWHNYSVHNRQRGFEIYQWYLRCDLCGHEATTKSSYKHGATHELPQVMFLTLFLNVASGYVTFHYAKHESIGNKTHEEKLRGTEKIEDCIAPSAIKVLDWTMSDEEGDVKETLQQLETEEAITIEFVDDSDAEVEMQGNSDDPNVYNSLKRDDDLLIKKSEFLTCKKCSFETQDAALLNIHGVQVHGYEETGRPKQYRCPEDGCPFNSKYFINFMRHLMNIHKYNGNLWRKETPSTRWKMKRKVKRKEGVSGVREPEVKHTLISLEAGPDCATNPDYHQESKREAQNLEVSVNEDRNPMNRLFDNIDKRHSREPLKWRLKCSHCPFETSLRKAAHRHGVQHFQVPIVTFHKYEDNQRRGVLKYRYLNSNLRAPRRCRNVGFKPMNMRHHMPNVQNSAVCRTTRKAQKHVGKRLIRNKTIARSITKRGGRADLGTSKHINVKDDSRSNKKKNNKISDTTEKKDFVDADMYSGGDQKEAGLEDPKNCIESDLKLATIDSDWISALEDEILGDDNHLQNQEAEPKPKSKPLIKRHITSDKIPGRVSFKCDMCGMSIVQNASLWSHTNVHAREENNFDLKVKFSKYKGDTRVDTVVMKADPAYGPKTNSNMPMYGARAVRSPELEYDSKLPVFACVECNFKTNKEPELTRHKELHWTKEKAAAFEAQNWFTCGECYYHCLDAATFKEHADKHKSRADMKIDVKKVEKDS